MILVGWVIMERMRLLTMVVGGCLGGLSMPDVIILGFVLVGALLSSVCRAVVNHDAGLCMRFGIEPF